MSLPTMSGVGRATADGELRFSPSGVAVFKVNLAFNGRKRQDDGTYVDDKVFFVEAVAFKQTAEHLAEAITRGTEVVVSGRLVTEQWDDKNGGGKRSKASLLIDSIGPAISNFQTAKVSKMERSGGNNGAAANSGGGHFDDPWATARSSAGQSANAKPSFDDEPPF